MRENEAARLTAQVSGIEVRDVAPEGGIGKFNGLNEPLKERSDFVIGIKNDLPINAGIIPMLIGIAVGEMLEVVTELAVGNV